jgi:peptidase E
MTHHHGNLSKYKQSGLLSGPQILPHRIHPHKNNYTVQVTQKIVIRLSGKWSLG